MSSHLTTEVLIIGGGLAGSAAAIELARDGRSVTLLERDREPKHKVCGEFLSAEATTLLHHLGISPAALGAVPIRSVRLCSGSSITESPLPFRAFSLTRKRLDAELLNAAQHAGVNVVRGTAARALTRRDGQWHASTAATCQHFIATDAILATGKHDLHGFARPQGSQADLIGLKMYLRLAPAQHAALNGHVDLLLHPDGYTGLQPVENGAANLCSVIRRSALAKLGGNWHALLHHIRQSGADADTRLANADPLLDKPLAIAPIPYGFVRKHSAGEHLWCIGDQAAVIPSFTGDGMSIALYSGLRAAQTILCGETAEAFQHQLHHDLRTQVARATAISRALVHPPAQALLCTLAHLWPTTLRWTAAQTRIPTSAMDALALAT